MNQWNRFLLQALLWLIVWLILLAGQDFNVNYILDNSLAYLFQIGLIAGLIFYGAKTLLLNKRYLLFTIISLFSIIFCAQISSSLRQMTSRPKQENHIRPPNRPPPMEQDGVRHFPPGKEAITPPGSAPPMFFIHLLMLSISFMMAAFIEVFVFARRKEEEHLRVQTEHLQTELKLLKTQINPHFLFNSLNNIYALSAIDSTRTQESISYLSDMLRYVLYECERPNVFLQKELDYIENYIRLFSLKSSQEYPIETLYEIEDTMVPVAPMIFIPFIENALKHSHIEKRGAAFINIQIQATRAQIHLKVINSKPSQKIEKDAVGGIGLENVKKRLAILYPNSHKLKIEENDARFSIDLIIKI